jgi:hypothetical protein
VLVAFPFAIATTCGNPNYTAGYIFELVFLLILVCVGVGWFRAAKRANRAEAVLEYVLAHNGELPAT